MTGALVATALGLAVTTVILAIRGGILSNKCAHLEHDRDDLKTAFDILGSRCRDEGRRYERLVKDLRTDIASLEQDMLSCARPDVVRARLRRMLLEIARRPAGPPLPPGPTATAPGGQRGSA